MPDLDFLKLPWEIQVALASGYAAYSLAYTGLRDRQRTIDVAFLSLVFSVPPTLVFYALKLPAVSIPLAFIAAAATALIWRRILRPLVFPILKKLNVTWSNDDPSALATLTDNSKFSVSQIAVRIDDGTWLRCDDLRQFEQAPFAPYVLGPNGDVAIYLTHEETPDGKLKPQSTVRDPDYGDRITYVPASRIKQIVIRHKARSNHAATAVDSSAVRGEEEAG